MAEIIVQNACNLLLAVVYRPPNCGYLSECLNTFTNLQTAYRHSLIFGDFNADMNVDTFDSAQIRSFVISTGMYLVPYGSTHHLKNSSTFLDLCIIDDAGKLINSDKKAVPFLSAHDLIEIIYNIKIERRFERLVLCRDFKNFQEQDFYTEVSQIDWTDLMTSECIDCKVQILNDKLLECLDRHAPLKQIRFSNLPAPWLSDEIRGAMRERDAVRKIWRRNRSVASHDRFRALRNKVQSLIRTAKKNYYLAIFGRKNDQATTWNKLRHLGLIKAKDPSRKLACSPDELNAFFAATGRSINEETQQLITSRTLCEVFDDGKFFFKYVSPDTVRKSLARIKSNAIGTDGISSRLINMTLSYVMPILENIFNYSLMHGTVPIIWKSAIITPIPKVGQPTEAQHYRPISILPFLSKVLERIVSDQLLDYLTDNDLLDPCQFAYRRNSSTQTCMIRLLDDVRRAADSRKVTISIFFDFSNAFDRVNPSVLIEKLQCMRLSNTALQWMVSYLSDRTQDVRDGSEGVTYP